jgi:dihydroceramidase
MVTQTHFCEYTYSKNEYVYELVNGFSSLIFCVYAICFVSFNSRVSSVLQYILSSMLFMCGIGSAMFHWTLTDYWRSADELPMLWMVTITNMYLVYRFDYFQNHECVKMVLIIILCSGLLFSTISNVSSENRLFFRTYFICLTAILCILAGKKISIAGYIMGGIGAICWLIDMYMCSIIVSYLHLHTIWHIGIGYFAYSILPIFEDTRNISKESLYLPSKLSV